MSAGPRLGRAWAPVARLTFLAMAAVHVSAASGLYVVPVPAILPVFLLVVIGQFLVIFGFNPGGRRPSLFARSTWRVRPRFRALIEGLRVIPAGWRNLALLLWFLYLPAVFFGSVLSTFPDVKMSDRLSTVLVSLFFGTFALLHDLCLRFVIPQKDEIRARIEDRDVGSR